VVNKENLHIDVHGPKCQEKQGWEILCRLQATISVFQNTFLSLYFCLYTALSQALDYVSNHLYLMLPQHDYFSDFYFFFNM